MEGQTEQSHHNVENAMTEMLLVPSKHLSQRNHTVQFVFYIPVAQVCRIAVKKKTQEVERLGVGAKACCDIGDSSVNIVGGLC